MQAKSVEVLIPLYNEEESIKALVKTIENHLSGLPYKFSFIFVDDGSDDKFVFVWRRYHRANKAHPQMFVTKNNQPSTCSDCGKISQL